MARRCSHCSHNGHNSRTCPTKGGVKLFGVRLTDGSIKKSASMGNLSSHYCSSSSAAASPNPGSPSSDQLRDPAPVAEGYVSDDPAHASCSSNCRGDRKKGIPWTEEEHRLFLMGLQKLGKGDWRGIARTFVMSRTPTQVASHAQKYFIRQTNSSRRKRRSSLFDMAPDMSMESTVMTEEHLLQPTSQVTEMESVDLKLPSHVSLNQECEPMEGTSNETYTEAEETAVTSSNFPPMIPEFFPAYFPVPFPFWPPSAAITEENQSETSQHQVLKPTPIHSKEPVNVDQLVGMSKLNLGEAAKGHLEPSPLSQKLLGASSRQSAFHAKSPVNKSDMNQKNSSATIIHAV